MKKYLASLCLALIAFSPVPSFAQGKMGIAAIVNNDVITNADVFGRYTMAVHGANIEPSPEEKKALQRQALDALVDETIRLQEASKMGVTPPKDEVQQAFAKVAEQNRVPVDDFRKALQQTPGLYESLLQQIKAQIAWANVVKKRIRPQINITESDINAYIAEKEKNPAKVEYQVAEIFMKNNENNQKLATQLVSEMRAGKQRFPLVARQFSEGLEASKGGVLGWIAENRLDPALDQALKTMKSNDISDPIVSPRGIHILLMREKRDVLQMKEGTQRLNIKQIIIPLPPEVSDEINEQALKQAEFLAGEAKNCAAMDEVLKKINSPTARDMGQVKLAELPSPIVNIVKDIPIGQISKPLRANDGIALFMVCGREENADEAMREDVANAIGTERLNRLQYRYYRDLRAAAYVDIK